MGKRFKKKPKKSKKKIILLSFLILVLILAIPTLYFNSKLSKLNTKKIDKSAKALGIDESKFEKSPEIEDNYVNILFLGIDTRDANKDRGRNDSTIIMSLDKKHKKVKLTSILRDTIMDMKGHGPMAGCSQDRLGHAHAYGGPELAIKVVNQNFNMNIKDYVKIDFFGLINIIDSLGGVPINVSEAERKVANTYVDEMSKIKKVTPTHITHSGMQTLNGMQAVGYARIRYVGNADYERTDRQRRVLNALFKKFSQKGILELPGIADEILPNVETSLDKSTILSLATYSLTNKVSKVEQLRLPSKQASTSVNHITFVDIDKSVDVPKLHQFIFEGDLK